MAFLKDVETEELRELVKSCFKEINSLKEQLNEENKGIKTNEVVKNVLIQNENQNSNLTTRINELTDEVNKKETILKEKDLQLQEKDTQLKEKDLLINELNSKINSVNVGTEGIESEYKQQISDLENTIEDQVKEIELLRSVNADSTEQSEKELKLELSRLREQNEELKSSSSQTEITQLRSVIDRQTEELKEIPVLKNQLTIEIAGRDQKIKKYEEEIESLNQQLSTSEVSELQDLIKSKDAEILHTNNKISELEQTIEELKNSNEISDSDELNQLKSELALLKEENDVLKASNVNTSSNNMSSLIEDFTKKSEELIAVQAELQKIKDLNKINEFKLTELENENAKLKTSVDTNVDSNLTEDSQLSAEIDSLKQKLVEKEELLSIKEKEIESLTNDLNSETETSEEDIDEEEFNTLKQDLINKTQEYDALQLDLIEKDATIKSFKQQYDTLETKYNDLEETNEKISEELKIITEKTKEQDLEINNLTLGDESNTDKIKELEALLSQKDQEIASLKVEIDSIDIDSKTTEETTDLQDELKETKKLLYEKDAEFDKLKLDYNQLRKSTTKQIDDLNDNMSGFLNNNEKLRTENEYLEKTLNDKNILLNKLKQENEALELTIKEKNASYDKLKDESFAVKKYNENQISKLKEEVQEKSDKVAALPQKIELKNIEISQLNKLLKTAENESSSKTETIKDLRNNIQMSQEEIKQLKDQLAKDSILVDDKLKAKDDEIFKLNERFTKESNEKDQEVSKLNSLLAQRQFKIEELNETINSLQKDLVSLNNQVEENSAKYAQSESIIESKENTIVKQDELLAELNGQIGRYENKLKLKDDDIDDLNTQISHKEEVIESLKMEVSNSNKKLKQIDVLSSEIAEKDGLISNIQSELDEKSNELQESRDTVISSNARIQELKDLVERKNKDIDDHKQLLFAKNEEIDNLKDLQPRIRALEVEKADLKSDYEKQITSLKADLQKAEVLKDNNEKLDQEISRLNEVVEDKDIQLANMAKFKGYFNAMISKPLPGLTSFQSQIYHLLPDAKSASELYDYLMDLGFTELEKESFAKTLKALEKRGFCQRARDGDRIIWVKNPIDLEE